METVSEIQPDKPKRGRPRKYSDEWYKNMEWIWGSRERTRRALQNYRYTCIAAQALEEDERFAWLCKKDAKRWRITILHELGRLDCPQNIRAAAERICDEKPTSKDAVAWLRSVRLAYENRVCDDLR